MAIVSRKRTLASPMAAYRTVAICVIAGALALMFTNADAATIPAKSGWSGYLLLGATYTDFSSNMVSGTKLGDMSKETIGSLTGSPDSDSGIIPSVNFELAYTWANSRTQVYAGNALIDMLTMDLSTVLGMRQEIGRNGTGYVALVFSGISTEVYSDPYVVNSSRDVTDRDSRGFRLGWSEIMGSKWTVEYTQRKIDLDNERSGTLGGLGLTPEQQQLLNREGDQYDALVNYRFKFDKHYLQPQLRYKKQDYDGRAMSNDGMEFQLAHGYDGERFATVVNVLGGWFDFDAQNPIPAFGGRTREDDILGIAFTIFDSKLIPVKGWSVTATLGYFEVDSNIDFYDSEVTLAQAGVFYRF